MMRRRIVPVVVVMVVVVIINLNDNDDDIDYDDYKVLAVSGQISMSQC